MSGLAPLLDRLIREQLHELGMLRPSAMADLRLMNSSYLIGMVYFPRENVTNPSRFGIFTFRSVCASIVSLSAMMPLRFRI